MKLSKRKEDETNENDRKKNYGAYFNDISIGNGDVGNECFCADRDAGC